MQSLVLESKENLKLKEAEKPMISKQQVLVKVSYVGVCGSDLPRYFDGKVHNFPLVLGHEFSGIIEEIGSQVESIQVGERVVIAPLVPCNECDNCKRGKPAQCVNYSFIGSREDGAMQEYVAVNKENIVSIPKEVSLKEAALVEPLTVAIHAIERVHFNAGAEIAIFGAGTIGMMTLLALKARGAGQITVIDISNEKLKKATEFGADHIINSKEINLNDYFSNHKKPEIVMETAGASQSQVQCIEIVQKLGKVVYVGTASDEVTFPPAVFEKILRGEIEITGSWMSYSAPFPGFEWEAALNFIKNKVIDVNPLINHIYNLEDKETPFTNMKDPENTAIKYLYKI